MVRPGLNKQLQKAGFSSLDIISIMEHVKHFAWIQGILDANHGIQNNPDILLHKVTEQFYNNTWVSQDFVQGILAVVNGSSAGMPLADLVYSLAMSRVLLTIRESLITDGSTGQFGFPGP